MTKIALLEEEITALYEQLSILQKLLEEIT